MAANGTGAFEFLSKTFIHDQRVAYKILKEVNSSDRSSEMQLMDCSAIDWLNIGIHLPWTDIHINHHQ